MDTLLIFSLVLAFLDVLPKKLEKLAWILTLIAFSLSLCFSIQLFLSFELPFTTAQTLILPGVSSYFRIDLFSFFLVFLSLFVCILITFFNFRYPCERKIGYYILLLLCEFSLIGVTFSFDVFTLFVFWEMMALSSYFLITFGGKTDELVALKYIFISVAGSAILLFSLALIFGQVHSLNFQDVANFVKTGDSTLMKFIFVLITVCFAIKAGIVPFHIWVPDTYQEAYTPTTVLFSSILSKLGLFVILRILFVFIPIQSFFQIILMILAIATMFLGNILALFEQDFKRLLAFSSIAQIGYILFAFAIFTIDSITAGLLHVINHSVVKALMFFIAGTCFYLTRKRKLTELRGIGRSNKILGFAIITGSFTLLSMPPFSVFISELLIILSGIKAGYLGLVMTFLFNLILSIFYYIRILRELILKKSTNKTKRIPWSMQVPILLLSIACVIFGLYPWPLIDFSREVANFLFKSSFPFS